MPICKMFFVFNLTVILFLSNNTCYSAEQASKDSAVITVEKVYRLKINKGVGSHEAPNTYYIWRDIGLYFTSVIDNYSSLSIENKFIRRWCHKENTDDTPSSYSFMRCMEFFLPNKFKLWAEENGRISESYQGIWAVIGKDEIEIKLLVPKEFKF